MTKRIGKLTLYSVIDLSKKLGVTTRTIQDYLRQGKLIGRKMGITWYVTEDSLRKYFEEPQNIKQKTRGKK